MVLDSRIYLGNLFQIVGAARLKPRLLYTVFSVEVKANRDRSKSVLSVLCVPGSLFLISSVRYVGDFT